MNECLYKLNDNLDFFERVSNLIDTERNIDIQCDEDDTVPEVPVPSEMQIKWINMLNNSESPLLDIGASLDFELTRPLFNNSFLFSLKNYFINRKKDSVEIFQTVISGSSFNCERLMQFGCLKEILRNAPNSFETVKRLLEKSQSQIPVTYFCNEGGVYLLALYSEYPEYISIVAEILLLISQNMTLNYETHLFPPDESNEDFFLDCEDKPPIEVQFDVNRELYFQDLIRNLLDSSNLDTIETTLIALQKMFKFSFQSHIFGNLLYERLQIFLEIPNLAYHAILALEPCFDSLISKSNIESGPIISFVLELLKSDHDTIIKTGLYLVEILVKHFPIEVFPIDEMLTIVFSLCENGSFEIKSALVYCLYEIEPHLDYSNIHLLFDYGIGIIQSILNFSQMSDLQDKILRMLFSVVDKSGPDFIQLVAVTSNDYISMFQDILHFIDEREMINSPDEQIKELAAILYERFSNEVAT